MRQDADTATFIEAQLKTGLLLDIDVTTLPGTLPYADEGTTFAKSAVAAYEIQRGQRLSERTVSRRSWPVGT